MKFGQRALRFHCVGSCLVGIIDVPERPIERGLLVVTDAAQYRVGGHRQFALLSRTLAGRGIPVMRFDHRGCGDSEGKARSCDSIDDDVRSAIAEFFMQIPDMKEIVVWGLGEAATAAALYAHTDPRVRGLILLNPRVGMPAPALRPGPRQYYLGRLGELGFWKKVATGNVDFAASAAALRQHLREAAADKTMELPERVIAALSCFEGQTLVILGGAGDSAREFDQLIGKHGLRCRRVEIPLADDTFASRKWRDEVAQVTAHWIVTW
ncbi:hydrolase 1, exosortase A system-associated [Massilia sp. RP-1-19]|uniref:Hydrolase 1, exosortase A system-associated n=1 Tax=Massilia polaris TaxID=2728846 RepID=A0A848HGK6_9BURK|nr:hydrolase 1, exosortase A system-associated [Massilia polaris]NML60187.1 hydrolase 1, exosortase A system-associated [Massilia polaris]